MLLLEADVLKRRQQLWWYNLAIPIMSSSRSSTGCWTCRLRKKKCDEHHPQCLNCISRDITCYGYGLRPDWMDGASLEAEQVRNIKRAAETNYKARRRGFKSNFAEMHTDTARRKALDGTIEDWKGLYADQRIVEEGQETEYPDDIVIPSSRSTTLSLSQQPVEDEIRDTASTPHRKPRKVLLLARRRFQASSTSPSISPGTMDSIWWNGSFANVCDIRNNKELSLLMHYLNNVFSLQFGFCRSSTSDVSPSWYLNTLLRSKPLYHATLSLSAYHQSLREDNRLSGPIGFSWYSERLYALTLKELQQQINSLQNLGGAELLRAHFEVLGIMNQALSLEVNFRIRIPNVIICKLTTT